MNWVLRLGAKYPSKYQAVYSYDPTDEVEGDGMICIVVEVERVTMPKPEVDLYWVITDKEVPVDELEDVPVLHEDVNQR